jgi:hypothetical protein
MKEKSGNPDSPSFNLTTELPVHLKPVQGNGSAVFRLNQERFGFQILFVEHLKS